MAAASTLTGIEGKTSSPTHAGSTAAATLTTGLTEYDDMSYDVLSVDVVAAKPTADGRELHFLVRSLTSGGRTLTVWRKYREFKDLHGGLLSSELLSEADGIVLPSKRWFEFLSGGLGSAAGLEASEPVLESKASDEGDVDRSADSTGDFADLRRTLLGNYLKDLLSEVGVARAVLFKGFLAPVEREDWPSAVGPIDLDLHDLPHASSYTEWWYYNMHFKDEEGLDYSAFVCFFRVAKTVDKRTGERTWAHALNFGFTDVEGNEYSQEVILDADTPAIVKEQLKDDRVMKDKLLRKAYIEVLDKGEIPKPDRMFKEEPTVGTARFGLSFETASVSKDSEGAYCLKASLPDGSTALDFRLTPLKPAVRHGLNGVVKGHDGDDMFYYCIPRCSLSGSFTVKGERKSVSSGTGWYDHEFGGLRKDGDESIPLDYAWNWAALQLDNDYELSVAILVDPRSKPQRLMETRAILIDPKGNRTAHDDLIFEGMNWWTSVRTFNSYPTMWRISIPSAALELHLEAPVIDQEFLTLIAKPAFYEGRVSVIGTQGGAPVGGVGFVERNGFQPLTDLKSFFKKVGKKTREAVRATYPDNPTKAQAQALLADKHTERYMEGVCLEKFYDGIIKPVRHLTDMGGKSWRSYAALACVDIVGGDSRNFPQWLAMPELLHVGSLIVDDIQDKSDVRRGVPAVHTIYGDEVAINAGTAAYFMCQGLLRTPLLNDKQMRDVYELYFAALRGGHAGQALDIEGLDYLMDDCISRRDAVLPESRILATHRLKTAVPAGCLARMGALSGEGSDEQIEAIGRYFEAVGIAFQIMDDILNLRGLYTNEADRIKGVQLKTLGEDITAGKVTFPVVKAIGLLPRAEMEALWETIKTKPADPSVVQACIDIMEKCGSLDQCVDQAIEIVEEAWRDLDPLVPASLSKIMLRTFGWFVCERSR